MVDSPLRFALGGAIVLRRTLKWVCVIALLFVAPVARAAPVAPVTDDSEPTPAYLKGVGIDEHLGAKLPLELAFRDEHARAVRLGDYFDGQHPVILTLNYSRCPMLCSLELEGLVKGLKALAWTAGKEFRIVTVSIDPTETPDIAAGAQRRYLRDYGRDAGDGWHFLSGTEANIHALAKAAGFNYRYDEKAKQFYHAAALMVVTPNGALARYLYGVAFTPETLRLALVESSEGHIGTTIDRFILYCCAYNPKQGSYAAVANRVMNLACLVVLIFLVALLLYFWAPEMRKRWRKKHDDESGHAH
ncbi:MAG TPA: SCO family protein [Polyangiaceae bacterium]|nr:SCO family protein [Polyangiaceae bacterium]